MVENVPEVELKGFMINKIIETEGRWRIRVDVSDLKRLGVYDVFYTRLSKLLTLIDYVWSEKATERNITQNEIFVRKRRDEKKPNVKRNVIEFVAIPSSLVNSIKYIRTLTYDAINEYALKIPLTTKLSTDMPFGSRENYIYIVPEALFSDLKNKIDAINRIVDDINYRKGRISQMVREGEEGKYSLKDYFHSPFWRSLRKLIKGAIVLNELGKGKLKELNEYEKQEIEDAIVNDGDIEKVIESIAKKHDINIKVFEKVVHDAEAQVKRVERYMGHVRLSPVVIDMSVNKLREWAERDPEIAKELRTSARSILDGMVRELQREAESLFNEALEKIKSGASAGKLRLVLEEIDRLNNKMKAIGMGEFEELSDLVGKLESKEIGYEDLENMIESRWNEIDGIFDTVVSAVDIADTVGDREIDV